MSDDTFYGRELNAQEQEVAEALKQFTHGDSATFMGVQVTRALFGAMWFVTNRSGYTCESLGRVPTAVHVSNLMTAYREQERREEELALRGAFAEALA